MARERKAVMFDSAKAAARRDEDFEERMNAMQAPVSAMQTAETFVEELPVDSSPDMQRMKGRIEAALFVTGKALRLEEVAELVEAPVEEVELALIELMSDFAFREGSALEIDDTDGYILQVKEDYGDIVSKMMPLELTAAELRTLSAIAIKAPIIQSDLIELRGSSAYEHIPELLKRKLISKRREGRSYILNVTKHFHEYFKLLGDKKELESLVTQVGREGGKAANEIVDEVAELVADLPDEKP